MLRRLLRPAYWTVRTWLETGLVGSAFAEWMWRLRLWGWYYTPPTEEAARHPHRVQVAATVGSFHAFSSLLEVGCGTGANLDVLAREYPRASYHGVDINPRAVALGKRYFRAEGLQQVALAVGRVDRLDRFRDRCVDVVLSDASLMFVGPDKIRAALREMARVARSGLVLNEYAARTPPIHNYDHGRFVHDYWTLLEELVPGSAVEVQKSAYGGGGWDQYGWLFVVRFRPDER